MEQTRRAEVALQGDLEVHPLVAALRALQTTPHNARGSSTDSLSAEVFTRAEVDQLSELLQGAVAPGEDGDVARAISDAVASGRLRGLVSSRGVGCHATAVNALLKMGYPWAFHISAEDLEESRQASGAANAARGDGLAIAASAVSLGALVLADQTSSLPNLGPAGVLANISGMAMALLVALGTSDGATRPLPAHDEAVAATGAMSAGLLYACTGSIIATASMLTGTALALLARRMAAKR